ncbi:MAG: hypothetical protein B7Z80_20510 [Rhodospirillales bacterium 20-64-7]|nr:MAG: hypothetical protein B7Z80_20510 [Rhodospirillales bacterium 20-64-7]
MTAPPPPAPVGHVFPTQADVPGPVSSHIKLSSTEKSKVQQAFNVIDLKSDLMVGALACNMRSEYDAFMRRFQPHILDEQHVMDAYFHRASGPYSGQKIEDTYVTLLANNRSVSGSSEGSNFCLNNAAEFGAVMKLHSPSELDQFATDQAPPDSFGIPMSPPGR